MPDEFKNMELRIQSVNKVNRTMDGINLFNKKEHINIVPTIYINDMYEHYERTEDLNTVLKDAADIMVNAIKETPHFISAINFADSKDNIIFQLVNTEQSMGMLADTPKRQFWDLSIIYRWVIKIEDSGIQSIVINNSLAEHLGLSEEELFTLALDNTRRLFPPTVKNMMDVLREIFIENRMPTDIADIIIGEILEDQNIWVISNKKNINGATVMLYEDELHTLAEKIGSDLYIMPSSIHECIAVSVNMGDPNKLAQIVLEINMDQVSLDERLSNQVYHYNKDFRKISMATDTPNKRLDENC